MPVRSPISLRPPLYGLAGLLCLGLFPDLALALPPPEDIPEEILRTEIITEARSPLNGEPLSAAEYATLQTQLQTQNQVAQVNPELRQLIFLLELRRVVSPIWPFF